MKARWKILIWLEAGSEILNGCGENRIFLGCKGQEKGGNSCSESEMERGKEQN